MKYKFNSRLENIETYDSKKLAKCRIVVCHDGENVNGSKFDMENILRCAEQSLRYSPILGSVIYDEENGKPRLNGHDMEYILAEGEEGLELKVNHIEKIYGFIPAEAEIWSEEINNRNYLVTEGYLWKEYMDDVTDILNAKDGNTEVSMEIEVKEYSMDEDCIMDIQDFDFLGITMLGVAPGMVGANLQMANFSMGDIKEQMEELCKVYSLEVKGGEDMDEKTLGEVQEEILDEVQQEEQQVEEQQVEEVEEQVEVQEEVVEEVVEEVQQEQNEEPIEEVQEYSYEKEYNELKAEYEVLKNSHAELQAKLDSMSDYDELKEFKAKYDEAVYNQEVEEISQMFALEESEVVELKEQALNKELTLDEFKKELALKFALKEMSNKKFNKNKVAKETSEIKVVEVKETETRPYGGKFDKYLKK